MNKNCINCKYYNNSICTNKNIPVESKSNIIDKVTAFIEDGFLSEGIKESNINEELNNIFLEIYREAGATKKNINNKKIDSEIEENDIYINEVIDGCISTLLNRYFNTKQNIKEQIAINDPYNFYCCMWE